MNDERVEMRLPSELLAELRQIAAQRGVDRGRPVTLAQVLRELLAEALAARMSRSSG